MPANIYNAHMQAKRRTSGILSSKKSRWILSILLLVLLLYILIARYQAPYWISSYINNQTQQLFNSEFLHAEARLNPFALSLTFAEPKLKHSTGTWFEADSVYANLSFWDLITANITVSEISLQQPDLKIITSTDGYLTSPTIQLAKTQPTDTAVNYLLERINIDHGSLDWQLASGQSLSIADFSIQLTNLNQQQTLKDLRLNLQTPGQAQLNLQLSGETSKYSGQFQLNNLQLEELMSWQLLTDDIVLKQGRAQASGHFDWAAENLPNLTFDTILLEDTDFTINNSYEASNLIAEVSAARIDLEQKHLLIDLIKTSSAEIDVHLPEKPAADNPQSSAAWKFHIDQAQGNNHLLRIHQNQDSQFPDMRATAFELLNFGTLSNEPGTFEAQLTLGSSGHVNAQGQLLLQPWDINTQFNLQQLALVDWQPVLFNDTGMQLTSGIFSGSATLQMQQEWQIQAQGDILDLAVQDTATTLLKLNQASIDSVSLDSNTQTIRIGCIRADAIQGQIPTDTNKKNKQPQSQNNNTWRVVFMETPISHTDNTHSCNLQNIKKSHREEP